MARTMITEDQLEQFGLDWFRTGGYDSALGSDMNSNSDVQVIIKEAE